MYLHQLFERGLLYRGLFFIIKYYCVSSSSSSFPIPWLAHCLYSPNSCELLSLFMLYNQWRFCSMQLLQSLFIFLSYYIRLVLADETVLCFLYDDFSATDLGTKAITKVTQQARFWLRTQTSHTLFQVTCRTFAYQQFQPKAHIEHMVFMTPSTSLSAEQAATVFRTSNATRAALGG
jgi:hypothetical protein